VTPLATSAVAPTVDAAEPVERHRRRRTSRATIIGRVVAVVLFLILIGLWQLKGSHGGSNTFSSPSLVVSQIRNMASQGELWGNLKATLWETLGGLGIGMVVGIFFGFLMGWVKVAGTIFEPYVIALNGLPRVALGPFFVVWFGIGLFSKMILAASLVFVSVLFNLREGVESIDKDLMDAMRSMHASRWELARYVVIPSVAPWTFAALKVAIGFALTGAVIGEFVGASQGLGWYISNSLNEIDMTGAVAALVLLALLALIMFMVVVLVERRYLRWRRAGR
jgi:NitT/TauT family transport system permease protein